MKPFKNLNYKESKELILKRLKRDMALHEQGAFNKMGEVYDDFDEKFPRGYLDLMIAWTFWDAWLEERNQGFPNSYEGITKEKWPVLAKELVLTLEKNEQIVQPLILSHFDWTEKPSFWEKLFSFFGTKSQRDLT